ncbi:hypothetical protein COT87_00970 [Candidatus Collierbacteria bacterium CG10_big_fil_rev_8_21_14_0_10_44_9]|uniref:O-antigen ligase domain-containing protein n=1 Tax=Candidatus Collierbacteria bacterium CG10_big_fil_rev_8_21_14_0_10_44_9 TaxID=1974535 RepID=A0A2H0VJ93_9BACT|nr:MAG: hypothetical protein COT87_00970 [Candidatus Collierbacteria bacterium CG10_big_fil_rev_8_21_14_0_10_44_9]
MAQKITHWLLITLILSLGFGQLLRFEFFGFPIYLHDILVVLILLFLFLQGQALQVRKIDLRGLALLGAGLTLGWLRALTLYPIPDLLIPALYTIRLLSYLVLYFIIKQSKIIIPKSYFLISGFLTLIVGLWQYFYLPDMRIFQSIGWDDHLSRLTLPHFDPTFTAVMLSLATLAFPKFFPLFIIGILLTYARSIWLSLILVLLYFLKNKLILLLTVSFMLLAIFILPKKFGEGTNLLRTYSISSRLQSDFSYIQKYNWDLLIGRGMNTLLLDQDPTHATSPNNSYLDLLVTTGILGLIGWGMIMQSIYLISSHKPMLIFFFIASLFNNVMFYSFAILWVLLLETTVPTSI